MMYAKIKNSICVNVIVCDSTRIEDNSLVALQEGFWIGDYYRDGMWSHTEPPSEPEPEYLTTAELAQALKEGVNDV